MWGDSPSRLRLLDLPFTAVEWILPDPWEGQRGGQDESTPRSVNTISSSTSSLSSWLEGLPEERLVFTLGDGRAGVLVVQGRKVQQDAAVVRPVLPGPEQLVSLYHYMQWE